MIVKIENKRIVNEIDKKDGYYNIEISKVKTEIEHAQYKYYYGYLVTPLAHHSFSNDIEKAHIYLKEKYLFYPCQDANQIPKEHQNRHIKYFYKVNNTTMLIGYLRSLTTLSKDEMQQYISKCEAHLLENGIVQIDADGKKLRDSLWQESPEKV